MLTKILYSTMRFQFTQLIFQKYSSIESLYKLNEVKFMNNKQITAPNVLWVATEKIHGANFAIHCNANHIRYARRNDFLTDDIGLQCQDVSPFFKQEFFNAKRLVNTFHKNIKTVYSRLKKGYPNMARCIIFGQFFGGKFPIELTPTKITQKYKPVQFDIQYTPQHEFMAFDIKVEKKNNSIQWVDVLDVQKYLQNSIKTVPALATGTFQKLKQFDIKIDSTIPQHLGLPKLTNNLIEGIILRPNKSIITKSGDRIMFKKKNQKFLQTKTSTKVLQQYNCNVEVFKMITFLSNYLNQNRVQSAFSKMPNQKDNRKFAKQIIDDILIDAKKDGFVEPVDQNIFNKLNSELFKLVMKQIGKFYQSRSKKIAQK